MAVPMVAAITALRSWELCSDAESVPYVAAVAIRVPPGRSVVPSATGCCRPVFCRLFFKKTIIEHARRFKVRIVARRLRRSEQLHGRYPSTTAFAEIAGASRREMSVNPGMRTDRTRMQFVVRSAGSLPASARPLSEHNRTIRGFTEPT
jgi:hypothetical protein